MSKATLSNDAGNAGRDTGAASHSRQQPQVTMVPVSELLRRMTDRLVAMPNAATHVIEEYIIQESLEPFPVSYVANVLDDEQPGLPVGLELPSAVAPSPDSGERRNPAPAQTPTPAVMTESTPSRGTIPTVELVLSPSMVLAAVAAVPEDPTFAFGPDVPVIPVPAPSLIPIPITRATAEQTPRMKIVGRKRHVPTSRRPQLLRIKGPMEWTVDEVAQYITRVPGCEKYAVKFRDHLIDGEALFLLNEHHLMNAMSMKLGPAVKICAVIRSLRETL
uniref:SAM domain-containing protein n=1 Tax=Amblyomma triste TaxID=251400 RepID=A0A023GH88_AMBTT